jgi:hypothetical protein
MSPEELISLQTALVYVFGPLLILAVPLVLALGTIAAILSVMLSFLTPRARGPLAQG